jgi:FtsP/CotA-like multicopper oxidase with cupredoxin domain/plastocyanin
MPGDPPPVKHSIPFGGISGRLASRLSRRRLIQSSAGSATTGALAAASAFGEPGGDSTFRRQLPEPQVHEFTLTASAFSWDLMDGVSVQAWGYNGQMPGPELRVREGDTVRATLVNQLPVPTTIHWHGINVPNAMDGVAGLNQAPVEPGKSFLYEFVATPAGTRWYHSHTDPAVQVPLGLYGAFIIEPAEPETAYDRDYPLLLAEWDTELTPDVAAGSVPTGPGDSQLRGGELGADLFLINGKMHGSIPPLMVDTGEQVLIRVIHAGAIPHPVHTHGHSFQIVATDGNPVPEVARLTKDTVLVGPAERYDLAISADNPGVWMVHCHIEHHMANGMMTSLWYEGHEPTGPAAQEAVAEATMAAEMDPASHHEPSPTAEPAVATPVAAGNGTEINMFDDRFDPSALTVAVNTLVVWVNKGRNWHSVASFDGLFDSGKIEPGAQFSFQFTAPGTFKYICKHHGMQGMLGTVTVT